MTRGVLKRLQELTKQGVSDHDHRTLPPEITTKQAAASLKSALQPPQNLRKAQSPNPLGLGLVHISVPSPFPLLGEQKQKQKQNTFALCTFFSL